MRFACSLFEAIISMTLKAAHYMSIPSLNRKSSLYAACIFKLKSVLFSSLRVMERV